MKKKLRILVMGLMVLGIIGLGTSTVLAGVVARGIDNPPGVPLYVIIEVTWDGVSAKGDWLVHGPAWNPTENGVDLSSCTECLDMNYDFTFRGPTVQFDEIFVDTVVATPQEIHVVLWDDDGDGTYTGSLAASHYFPWGAESDAVLYFDRIDYEITFDEDGNVTDFHYFQYEHKKLREP